MSRPITGRTVALVGFGRIGRIYAELLARIAGIEQVVVVDVSPEARAAFARDYGQREDWAFYPELDYLGRHVGMIDRGIVATPPAGHVTAAGTLLDLGADVIVEKGGKTLSELTRLKRRADRQGRVIASPFHQLTEDEEVVWSLASGACGPIEKLGYTWLLHEWAEPFGPIDDRGPHAIAWALATIGNWQLPGSVRAEVVRPGLERFELLWDSDQASVRSAKVLLGADRNMPHEVLERKALTRGGVLLSPGRTTKTPTDREYVSEFVDLRDPTTLPVRFAPANPVADSRTKMLEHFLRDPRRLPVIGERALMVQSVVDAVLMALATGEIQMPRPVTP